MKLHLNIYMGYENLELCPPPPPFVLQSNLGYPATTGRALIRISDLAGYWSYALTQQVQ